MKADPSSQQGGQKVSFRQNFTTAMRPPVSLTLLCLLFISSAAAWGLDKPIPQENGYKSSDLAPFLQAAEWTIFSLDPLPPGRGDNPFAELAPAPGEKPKPAPKSVPVPKPAPEQLFHNYLILGQTTAAVTPNLKTVITTLDEAGRLWTGAVAGCFNPRHGIRVTTKDSTVLDIIICYECSRALLYRGDKHIGTLHFVVEPQHAPRPAFLNGALLRAKAKMPPSPRK